MHREEDCETSSTLRRCRVVAAGRSKQALEQLAINIVMKRSHRAVGEEEVGAGQVGRAPVVGRTHLSRYYVAVVGGIVVGNQKRGIVERQIAKAERAGIIVKRNELIRIGAVGGVGRKVGR